jgi:catalase
MSTALNRLTMASNILNGAKSVAETVKTNMADNKKIADLERNKKDQHSKQNATTDFGTKVHDLDHWLKNVDPEKNRIGSSYLEDQIGRERIHRFDHERIPERVVHARGAAAHGHFKLYESAEDVTYAPVLTDTSRTTPVFLRFSTVQGSRGSADTVRDVRGFAIKFYTVSLHPAKRSSLMVSNSKVIFPRVCQVKIALTIINPRRSLQSINDGL